MTALKSLQTRSETTEQATLTPQESAVLEAIRALSFGSVEIVVHQGRVAQIVRSERIRFEPA